MNKWYVRWIENGKVLEHVFLGINCKETAFEFYDCLTYVEKEITCSEISILKLDLKKLAMAI